MNDCFIDTVPLSTAVKAAAMDFGEDFTKVEASFGHWAVRGLKEISRRLLRLGTYRELIPINQNLHTATLPLGCNRVFFVGIIDECGEKQALAMNGNLVPHLDEPAIDIDRCNTCNQPTDICEKLNITEVKETVTINGEPHDNTVTRYFEGGGYYEITKTWLPDLSTGLAIEITQKKFIADLSLLPCGCIAPTEHNISCIKDNCPSCYSCCYSCCVGYSEDLGGYKVIDNSFIQLEENLPYKNLYIVYQGALPRKNGVYHIPTVAFEALVGFIKLKYSEHKKHYSIAERDRIERKYYVALGLCQQIIGRMKLSEIKFSIHKVPQVNLSYMRNNCCYSDPCCPPATVCPPLAPSVTVIQGGSTTITVPAPPPTIVIVEAVIGGAISISGTTDPVTGISDGSTLVSSNAFIGKRVRVTFNNTILRQINSGGGENYFTKITGSANVEFPNGLATTDYIKIETIE